MPHPISHKLISLSFGILVLVFLVTFYISAWTEPSATPPGGNVAAPINVGANSQYKSGALGVGGVLKSYSDVQGARLCIGTDCRTSWPSGAGAVTSVSNSDGTLTISPTTGAVVASLNLAKANTWTGVQTFNSGFCLAGGCITNYSALGDITSVNVGTGLSGGGSSGDVTLSADTTYLQRRVSGTCAAGSSIRVVNSDGTVTCQTDNVGITSEADPQVGTLINGKWCTTNGTAVNCTSDLPGGIGGSGTANYLSKFTGAATLGSSQIIDNGTLITTSGAFWIGGVFETNNETHLAAGGGNVGIGTTNPGVKLDVNGNIKIVDGTQGSGKVLTSDANGVASWQTPASAPVPTGLYGWCTYYSWTSPRCAVAIPPAYCSGDNCACPAGYTRLGTGTYQVPGAGTQYQYSCYKN